MTDQQKNKSFILHIDSLEVLDQLSDDQAGKLFKAIFSYQKTGETGEVDQLIKIAINPFLNQFKRDKEKWQNECKIFSDKGKLGNLKRWHFDLYKKVLEEDLSLENAMSIANDRPPIAPDRPRSLKSLKNVSDSNNIKKEISKDISKKSLYQPLVDGLKFILEEKLKKQISTKGWEKDIQLLIERDLKERQNAVDDVKKAIQAISDNFNEQYFPVIQSANSLRAKFSKIEAFLDRKLSPHLKQEKNTINQWMGDF